MCGIIGYFGKRQALDVLINGLKSLEYRGYDSSGVSVFDFGSGIKTIRAEGKILNLEKKIKQYNDVNGNIGIAHTRWATHGVPSEKNSHPHRDCSGDISIVHNGIIENHENLKDVLLSIGHSFDSDTDSEVIAHMIENFIDQGYSFVESFYKTLPHLHGTYGVVAISKNENKIIGARMGSPLVVGVGVNEYLIASDVTAIIKHTKDVIYLDDGEVVLIDDNNITIETTERLKLNKLVTEISWDYLGAQKNGQPHFMLKEIFEQPETIQNSIRGRIDFHNGNSVLGGLKDVECRLKEIDRIVIVGCGSAYYAGLIGEYLIEEISGIPVEVELASEFRYRKPILSKKTAVLAVSQSGETADTLEAIREAKRKNVLTLGIVNTVGSTIARETDAGIYNHAGPEIGVASTKAFVSQIVVLCLLALNLGRSNGNASKELGLNLIKSLTELPDNVQSIINDRNKIKNIAKSFLSVNNCFFLGRKFMAPIAYEGSLKLKEVSYIHAEGYTSGEMKHGPIALIDDGFPAIILCPKDSVYNKTLSNIEELNARKCPMICVTTTGNSDLNKFTKNVIYIPNISEYLLPVVATIPLQLFAYYASLEKGLNPDMPRNLAKSVTVE